MKTGTAVAITAVVAGGIGVLIGKYALAAPVPAAGALGYRSVPTGRPMPGVLPNRPQSVAVALGLTPEQCQAWASLTHSQKFSRAAAEIAPGVASLSPTQILWVQEAVGQRDLECARVANQYMLGQINTG